jgi:HEAT repeat protein
LRKGIVRDAALRLARRHALISKYKDQIFALRCFNLFTDPQDEDLILDFLKNRFSLVRFEAIRPAIRLGTASAVYALLEAMRHETRFSLYPYKDAFVEWGPKAIPFIEQSYGKAVNWDYKIACLKALSVYEDLNITDLIQKDISSESMEFKIEAAKVMGKCPADNASALLLQLLEDKSWEVRAQATNSLGLLKVEVSVPRLLEGLKDKNWWVRMNSAQAILKTGPVGRQALEGVTEAFDGFGYETARYVLSASEYQ